MVLVGTLIAAWTNRDASPGDGHGILKRSSSSVEEKHRSIDGNGSFAFKIGESTGGYESGKSNDGRSDDECARGVVAVERSSIVRKDAPVKKRVSFKDEKKTADPVVVRRRPTCGQGSSTCGQGSSTSEDSEDSSVFDQSQSCEERLMVTPSKMGPIGNGTFGTLSSPPSEGHGRKKLTAQRSLASYELVIKRQPPAPKPRLSKSVSDITYVR